jgi:hypothetical protein
MRRSPVLLVVAILAFARVFVLGLAAVFAGMTDYGGASSALLRIFQVYTLFFVYAVILQYLKPAAREVLRVPSLVAACASFVLSALALIASIRASRGSSPIDALRMGGSVLVLLLLDFLVMGLLALDGLRRQAPREQRPQALGPEEPGAQPQIHDNTETDTTHEVH